MRVRNLHRWVAVPLVAAVALLGGVGCRGWASSNPPVHLNPNMDTQHKLKPYRSSPFFENGRAMQMPIEGTVARTVTGEDARDNALLGVDDHMYKGLVGGKPAVTFPESFESSKADVLRGRERYDIYCAPCHARDGSGAGTVARRLKVKPPTFHQERIWQLSVGDLFGVITHGKNMPNMPSYAAQIPHRDRWAIALYMRALMRTQKPDLPLLGPGATAAAPADGAAPADAPAEKPADAAAPAAASPTP